jgi:predicted amidophosphoribosyltransferase
MPSVTELTALYTNFMLGPRPGPETCAQCFNFTRGFDSCYACDHNEAWLAAVAPISYSVALEQLHHALRSYKRIGGAAGRRLTLELASVLWRFLDSHEHCVARAANTDRFALVTTVPCGDPSRDQTSPLRAMVGEIVGRTHRRYERLLRTAQASLEPHAFDLDKFTATRPLDGEPVLLIDDTWTTGASAQSAAAVLRRAGAGPVAAVAIGRHLNREWHENDRRLRGIGRPFDWERCALCDRERSVRR